jgi:hypothetical protein
MRNGVGRLPNDDDVLQRLARVETKIDILIEDKHELATAIKTANEADQRARSAHHRLDEIADNQRWLWRTVVGGIIAAAIGFLTKLKGG